jgi:hypothetical protein
VRSISKQTRETAANLASAVACTPAHIELGIGEYLVAFAVGVNSQAHLLVEGLVKQRLAAIPDDEDFEQGWSELFADIEAEIKCL